MAASWPTAGSPGAGFPRHAPEEARGPGKHTFRERPAMLWHTGDPLRRAALRRVGAGEGVGATSYPICSPEESCCYRKNPGAAATRVPKKSILGQHRRGPGLGWVMHLQSPWVTVLAHVCVGRTMSQESFSVPHNLSGTRAAASSSRRSSMTAITSHLTGPGSPPSGPGSPSDPLSQL